jgi:hypothetical protein
MGPRADSSRFPYADRGLPYASLTRALLRWFWRQGVPMLDVLMVVLTVVVFGLLFALIAGLERV